jgi:hypothetical protein
MALMDVTVNATRILHSIWMNPGISRISLARELNLNKSTITKIVTSLLKEGLINLAEMPDATNNIGRKPTGLYLNNGMGVIIGIEIQTDGWIGVAVNPNGDVLDTFFSDDIPADSRLEPLVKAAIDTAVSRQQAAGHHVLGVGLGISGQVDPYTGIVFSSNPLNVHKPSNIYDFVTNMYPFPIVIENDANCCCWNVIMKKKSNHERNFLCLLTELRRTGWCMDSKISEVKGVAVGLGIVIKDSVLHGNKFSAGEFQSVFKIHDNPSQFNLSIDELSQLHTDRVTWEKVVRELGRNIALLVNSMNMSMVNIFGTFVLDGEKMKEILREEIQTNWLYDSTVECAIEISDNGKQAVAIGATGYFLNRIFSLPDIWEGNNSIYPEGIKLLRQALRAV